MSADRVGGGPSRPQVRQTKEPHAKQPAHAPKRNEAVKTEANPTEDAFAVKGAPKASASAGTSGKAVEGSGPFGIINKAADTLGGALRRGGELIERGSQALAGNVPGGSELRELGKTVQQVGRGIQDVPEVAVAKANEVQKQVRDLIHQGQDQLHRAEQAAQPLIAQGVETVKNGLGQVRSGLDTLRKGVTDFAESIAHATDFRTHINKLGTGDKYTLGLGGMASVEGAKIHGAGQIEVSRGDDGRYTVSADGKIGAGIYGQLGASVGAKAELTGEWTLGIGGRVEFRFATPEEAGRATEALLRQAAVSAVSLIPGGQPAGPLAQKAIGPSADDLKLLTQNISAVELRGETAAKLGAGLSLGERGIAEAGLFGEGKVESLDAARLEFEKGKPPTLIHRRDISGEVSGGLKAGLKLGNGAEKDPTHGSLLSSMGGSARGTVSAESRITLPSNIHVTNLYKDPLGALNGAGVDMANSARHKVTVSLESNGQALGTGLGLEAKVEFNAKPAELLRNGALQHAIQGQFESALKAAGDAVEITASVAPFSRHGVSLSPEVSFMGFGVELEGQAIRQDVADKPLWEFKGTATQAGQNLHEFLEAHPERIRAERTTGNTAALALIAGSLPIRP